MFFRRCQNENRVRRRFLQGFQKGIEGLLRQHVNLINDEHFVLSLLRLKTHLFDERPNVFDTIIGGCIQLGNIERGIAGVTRSSGEAESMGVSEVGIENGAEIADQHILVRPGSDAFLLMAMIHTLVVEGIQNLRHLADWVDGS